MTSSDTPSALLRRYLEAFPDLDAVGALLAEDVRFTLFAGPSRTNTGRERILRGLAREFATFYRPETFRLQVLDAFGDAERAAGRYVITAETALGPYRNNYVVLARFTGGLLVEGWEYVDSASAAAQLSAGPKASAG